ncbi:MAG: 2-oxoacid:acceptor oxidoreductase family protein [Candidatus Sericytochromatia bacterium]
MKKNIVLLGHGGQGVLFAGKILAHAAAIAGYQSSYIPSSSSPVHNSNVKAEIIISDEEIFSPFIEKADYTIVFHKFRLDEAKNLSNENTKLFFKDFNAKTELKNFVVDTEKSLDKNKSAITSNIIMLGALITNLSDNINIDDKSISEALKQELIHKPFSLVNQNFKAYKQGKELFIS